MLSSAISSAVKSARKMKKVAVTDVLPIFDAAMPHGHQVLNGPRLPADFGQHPARLRREVGQRYGPYGDP